MNVIIEGLGSIAMKHIDALTECKPDAQIFALRSGKGTKVLKNVTDIYDLSAADQEFDFAIISNPSFKHFESINRFIDLGLPLFIEKPALTSLDGATELVKKVNEKGLTTYVACNLRFLPIFDFLKKVFTKNTPIEISCYAGSYLPDWRPHMDYRTSYSALDNMGGGVHLDLIHELDYIFFLLGKPEKTQRVIGKISNLEINSADYAHYHLQYPGTMVSVSLNYFRKVPKRQMEIVFEDSAWLADLAESTITDLNTNELVFSSDVMIKDTYKEQMAYFLTMLNGQEVAINDLNESIEVLKICLNETS